MSIANVIVTLSGKGNLDKFVAKTAGAFSTLNKAVNRGQHELAQSTIVAKQFERQIRDNTRANLVATAVMRGLGKSIDNVGDQALDATAKLGLFEAMSKATNAELGGLSVNVGAFTISLRNLTAQVPLLLTSIGSLTSIIGGLTAALVTASAAFTALITAGGIGFLQQIQEEFADVTTMGEAMQKIIVPLRDMFIDAFDPLITSDNVNLFINTLESLANFINRTSQAIAQFRDEFVAFWTDINVDFDELATAMNNMFLFDPETEAFETAGDALQRLLNYFLDALPRAINFFNGTIRELGIPIRDVLLSVLDLTKSLVYLARQIGDEVLGAIESLIDLFNSIVSVLSALGPLLTSVIAEFAATAAVLFYLTKIMDGVLLKMGILESFLLTNVKSADDLRMAFSRLGGAFFGFLDKHFPALETFFQGFSKNIPILKRFRTAYDDAFEATMTDIKRGPDMKLDPGLIRPREGPFGFDPGDPDVFDMGLGKFSRTPMMGPEGAEDIAPDVDMDLARLHSRRSGTRKLLEELSDQRKASLKALGDMPTLEHIGNQIEEEYAQFSGRDVFGIERPRRAREALLPSIFGDPKRGQRSLMNRIKRSVNSVRANIAGSMDDMRSSLARTRGMSIADIVFAPFEVANRRFFDDLPEMVDRPFRKMTKIVRGETTMIANAMGRLDEAALSVGDASDRIAGALMRVRNATIGAARSTYGFIKAQYLQVKALAQSGVALLKNAATKVINTITTFGTIAAERGLAVALRATAASALKAVISMGAMIAANIAAAASFIALHVASGGLTLALAAIVTAGTLAVGIIGQLPEVVSGGKGALSGLKNVIVAVGKLLIEFFVPIWNLLIDAIELILSPVFAIIDGIKLITGAFGGSGDAAEDAFSAFDLLMTGVKLFGSVLGIVGDVLDVFGDIIYFAIIAPFKVIASIIRVGSDLVRSFIKSFMELGVVTKVIDVLASTFERLKNFAEDTFDAVLDRINRLIQLANTVPGINISPIGGAGGASTRLQGARVTSESVRQNLARDRDEPSEEAQTSTTSPEFNFNEYIENNTTVDAMPEDKQRIKGLVDTALKDANTYRRQRDARSG